ncbi:MAG: GNAT family N-acetyltransferase [Candidatus Helarchaeota archaeon]
MASEAKVGVKTTKYKVPKFRTRNLRKEDAEKVVELFNVIYNGNYPLQEYLDIDWIKSQVNNPNRYFKVFEDSENNFLGCGVIDFDPDNGILYGGRTVIYPEYQGKGILGGVGMETTRQIMRELNGKVKIFYGTSRMVPGDTGMQRTLEKIGFKPVAFLPDLDIGVGVRESEIFQALIFSYAFKKRRRNPRLLPEFKNVINAVQKQYRQIKDYIFEAVEEIVEPNNKLMVGIFEDIHDYYIYITISCGPNRIKIEINPKSKSAEIQEYNCHDESKFLLILKKLVKKMNERNIKFLEAHVSAYLPKHQKIFLQAGFKATGYIPVFDTVEDEYEDRLLMVWTPGKLLTPCLEFTPKSWDFVKHFIQDIGLNGTTKEVARGHIQYNNFMSLE